MATKFASVQYRYVKLDGLWEDFDLKAMIVDVLRRAAPTGSGAIGDYAKLRKKDLDQDGSYVVLNKLSKAEAWDQPVLFGQLIHVKSGAQLPGINGSLDDDVAEFELQTLSFEQLTQIVEGVLYFAVVKNHVGMIEGQRTRGRTLERYLTRLLQDAGELEAGKTLVLNARLEGTVRDVRRIDMSTARALAKPADDQQPSSEAVVAKDAAREEGEGATVLEVLRILGWKEDQIEGLLQQVPDGGWVEGLFTVLFKRKNRRSTTISREKLEEALRNLDSSSVGLLGEGGRERGGLIKLSERCSVACEGDLLDPEDAMNKIVASLKKWASEGRIDISFG